MDFLGEDFCDVSVFYAQLGPISGTRTCVSLRDIWVVFYCPLYLAVACATLSVPEEYSFAVFLCASWFDSGYMVLSVYEGVGDFTYFYVKVDSACSLQRLLDVLRAGELGSRGRTHIQREGELDSLVWDEFHTFYS